MFSRIYLKNTELINDSKRFRVRLYGFFSENFTEHRHKIAGLIKSELGVHVPYNGGYLFGEFFKSAELRDVLDSITIIFQYLRSIHHSSTSRFWLEFVRRAMSEEGVSYKLDDNCVVHYLVDEEFELNRISTISKLGDTRYGAVLAAYESAHQRLDIEPMDTKSAVRDMFESAEILCKIITNGNNSLDERLVKSQIKPIANRKYASTNSSAVSFSDKLLESFCDWVNAGHKYRHGQNTDEPEVPPVELAFAFISMGGTYIRLLLELVN